MKNLLQRAATLAKRVYQKAITEPVAVRAAVAAVVNVLVLSGFVPAPFAEDVDRIVQGVLVAVASLGLILSARAKVTADSDLVQLGAMRRAQGD